MTVELIEELIKKACYYQFDKNIFSREPFSLLHIISALTVRHALRHGVPKWRSQYLAPRSRASPVPINRRSLDFARADQPLVDAAGQSEPSVVSPLRVFGICRANGGCRGVWCDVFPGLTAPYCCRCVYSRERTYDRAVRCRDSGSLAIMVKLLKRFFSGDKVFAKVRGYPPWPAKVSRDARPS